MDKIVLCSNNDKRMQLINSIETCVWKNQKWKSEKEEIKCKNIIKTIQKMINFHDATKVETK